MEFIFVCPNQNMTFASADFSIIENKGVICDNFGNKTLDAKVELNVTSPFCGERHIYLASELSCPFEILGNSEASKKNQ